MTEVTFAVLCELCESLGDFIVQADADSGGEWWGLGSCISSKPPGDAHASKDHIFFFFFVFFFFLGLYLQHMEVPRLGVELEL